MDATSKVTNVVWRETSKGEFTPYIQINPIMLGSGNVLSQIKTDLKGVSELCIGDGLVLEVNESDSSDVKIKTRLIGDGKRVSAITNKCPECGHRLSGLITDKTLKCDNGHNHNFG